MMLTLYGIPNCDTVKKARAFLGERETPYRFHDFRKDGIDAALAQTILTALGPDAVINRRGTTWRTLDDEERASADTDAGCIALMLRHPGLIKRPVWRLGDRFFLGFDPREYDNLVNWLATC